MKFLIFTMLLSFALVIESKAQSDTLVINLKNGTAEKIAVSQIQKIQFENITSVSEPQKGSSNLQLIGNYPNPFAEQTNIEFEIASVGAVEVIIYDNLGKMINTIKCENCAAGKNSMPWNCLDNSKKRVQSGVYYYEVHFNNETQSKKMILVK